MQIYDISLCMSYCVQYPLPMRSAAVGAINRSGQLVYYDIYHKAGMSIIQQVCSPFYSLFHITQSCLFSLLHRMPHMC